MRKNQRRSIRLANYDYAECGAYFVTVCVYQRRSAFGRIENGAMRLNDYGRIVAECWNEIPTHFPNTEIDQWIVMPNHVHGVVVIAHDRRGLACQAPTLPARFARPVAGTLGTMMGSFKSAVTRRINAHRATRNWSPAVVWQRNYYERIIRNETELDATRRYVAENPQNWPHDENNPDNTT